MKIIWDKDHILVIRELGDKRPKNESIFWYQVKKKLKEQGEDLVKKQMWKDDHLVDNNEYYLRDRKWKYCIYDPDFQLRKLHQDYWEGRRAYLPIHYW